MTLLRLTSALCALLLVSCGGDSGGHDGHDHDGHDHAHDHDHGDDHHGHVHTAPHGGVLVILGKTAAHVEIVLDPERGELSAYVLGSHAEKPVRVEQETLDVVVETSGGSQTHVLEAQASVLTGETVGDTSQFSITAPELKGLAAFQGTLGTLTVRGTSYTDLAFSYPE